MFRSVAVLAFAISAIRAAALLQLPTATTTLTQQDSNIYRSFGNLGQVSTSSKTISTPFSSVSKSDVRISNPGGYHVASVQPIVAAVRPGAYYAGPAVTHPANVAGASGLGVRYSIAPAVSHMSFSNGLGVSYAW